MGTQRKKFKKGYRLKAADLNDIWDAIEQYKIVSSPTVRAQSTPGGTSLTAAQPRGGSSQVDDNFPFDIFATLNTTTNTVSITFYPGTLNQQLPSNMFNTLTCSGTGLFYITLDVTTNGKQTTNCVLSVGSTAPTPPAVVLEAGPNAFSILIGVISNGTSRKIADNANLVASLTEVFRTSKDDPQPFALPYDSYYTFTVRATTT